MLPKNRLRNIAKHELVQAKYWKMFYFFLSWMEFQLAGNKTARKNSNIGYTIGEKKNQTKVFE